MAAFWLPVFETPERTITGYWVFATGWMGFAMFQFAWYANLLMLMAVILMYSAPLRATLLAAAGLLVATQAFWFDILPGTATSTEIVGQGIGFWVWYASIFLLGIGVVFGSDDFSPDEGPVAEEVVVAEEEVVVVSDEEISSVTRKERVPVFKEKSAPPSVVNEEDFFVIEEEAPFVANEEGSSSALAEAQGVPKNKSPDSISTR